MARAYLFILDSFGIGGAPDAEAFGDTGANTLGHIADHYAAQGRSLHLPHLNALGLGRAAELATGKNPLGDVPLAGRCGSACEVSRGKDTPSGHWEIAGVPVLFDWGYFPATIPTFPRAFTDALMLKAGLPGFLGNKHASGTEIIAELGEEHMRSGKPIIYTSADSVIQIAAHEESFGLRRLYDVCAIARELSRDMNIGRVIARPFTGASPASFTRTGNRKDYSVLPPAATLLDVASQAGRAVVTIGKIGDIYAHSGTGREIKASGNEALMATTLAEMPKLGDGGFLMTNFVDFDMVYGHRRDAFGYGAALEAFDRWLPSALALLQPGDLVMISADHGCDPTWRGTDHTREQVPVLVTGPGIAPGSLGVRDSFADMGQSIARHLGLPALKTGRSFL